MILKAIICYNNLIQSLSLCNLKLLRLLRLAVKTSPFQGDNDNDNLISQLGGKHITCADNEYHHDKENCILSTPAYMLDDTLSNIAAGIDKMIKALSAEIK